MSTLGSPLRGTPRMVQAKPISQRAAFQCLSRACMGARVRAAGVAGLAVLCLWAGWALAGEEPAGQEPAGEEPAGQEPAAQEPAGEELAGEEPALPAEVEALLSEPSAASEYAEEERCLSIHRIREVDALDDRHVVFRLSRKALYLVQLPHRCPGLRRNDPVAYESQSGMSVCTHDAIRGTFRYGPGDTRLGPPCSIPGFQEITVEQLALLRESLRQRR